MISMVTIIDMTSIFVDFAIVTTAGASIKSQFTPIHGKDRYNTCKYNQMLKLHFIIFDEATRD